MAEFIDIELVNDCMSIGGIGFAIGFFLPMVAWLLGSLVDSIKVTLLEGERG